ncbi:MAG: metallophosphoesterase [Bacteroidota bacterium]
MKSSINKYLYKFSKTAGFWIFVMLLALPGEAQNDTLKYFFEGHTYQWHTSGNKVDERLEKFDFSEYDGIWLGGDVCSEALLEYSTLEYIDEHFDLKHPNTHWAMGNHDARNGNWIWLEELTGKKTYYTSTYKGITYMVLNTCLTPYDCEQLNDQYRIIVNLCDTIQKSSHLILLMHHGIWEGVPGLPHPYQYAQSNLKYYSFTCDNPEATFLDDIYPRLLEVKERGIEVILILGDMGSRKIDFVSDDGIHFLGTGLNRSYYKDPVERENSPRDWYLEFKHVPKTGWLEWKYHDLDSVIAQ